MNGILLTQNSTFIIGQVAWLLGKIMEGIFEVLNMIGIPNIGLAIILFTIVVNLLMMPLTIKQQKFSKLSAKMNPEIQAIQAKYKNRKDQDAQLAQNQEIQAVYAKYGVSPTGSCLYMLIQMPILFALYRVIYAIPAYVDKVKAAYYPLVTELMNSKGAQDVIMGLKSAAQFKKQGFTENTIIDVLNKASTAEWDSVAAAFPDLSSVMETARQTLDGFNNFFGLNIANSPWYSAKQYLGEHNYLFLLAAIAIPVLAGLTQWVSVRLMPQAANGGGDDSNNEMMQSMKAVNNFMPLMSVYFCAVLPVGVGLYWVMSGVVRMVQQLVINKYLSKMDIDEEIKKNIEKYNRKREKDGLPPEKLNNVARTSVKSVNKKPELSAAERAKQIQDSTEFYKNTEAKPGSLAAKARMVEKFDEKNKKK